MPRLKGSKNKIKSSAPAPKRQPSLATFIGDKKLTEEQRNAQADAEIQKLHAEALKRKAEADVAEARADKISKTKKDLAATEKELISLGFSRDVVDARLADIWASRVEEKKRAAVAARSKGAGAWEMSPP
eukprot:NODE_2310_length_1152_cov_2.402539_g1917_i0.p2 GENE.NODE_2310_length_1152_cov_2.402539_g1917_i0~~NODE_2310_length_1152_cov_2.402539_g1917_i0.p2  ORF type:complete len:130 (+),score=29.38 NODE_2310_length_1152_cov_2.402539_g1917_i0:69-458(+)